MSLDLPGAGESEAADGPQTTELLADVVAAFMRELDIERAHVFGRSLGAAVGTWLAAKYPERVTSLSLHGAWPKTEFYLETVVRGWQTMAKALGNVPEMVVSCIFPWCLTPDLYAAKPEYVRSLAEFVRSRPAQTVPAFLRQSDAVLAHDAEDRLSAIAAPTLVTFGSRDHLTSTRFAERLVGGIRGAELLIFDDCAHAALYEHVEEFNEKTLAFLRRHARNRREAGSSVVFGSP